MRARGDRLLERVERPGHAALPRGARAAAERMTGRCPGGTFFVPPEMALPYEVPPPAFVISRND